MLSPLRRRRPVRRHCSRRCFQERLRAPPGAGVFFSHLRSLPGFRSTVYLQRLLLQPDRPPIQVFLSFLRAAAGASSHHFPLEFFLEVLLLLGFEAWRPSEELPRFLLLGVERSFFSTRVFHCSRSLRSSSGLLFTSC